MDKYWYALSPRNQLLVGRGAVIEGYIDSYEIVRLLRALVDQHYSPESEVPIDDFGYPFVSAVAGKYIPTDQPPKPVRNLAEAVALISPIEGSVLTTQEIAVRFYNSIMAAELSKQSDDTLTAERIMSAFKHGELLIYGRDAAKLSTNKVKDKLPGVLVFLLNGEAAKKANHQDYLRRGNQLGVSAKTMAEIARIKRASDLLHPETVDEEEELMEVYDA